MFENIQSKLMDIFNKGSIINRLTSKQQHDLCCDIEDLLLQHDVASDIVDKLINKVKLVVAKSSGDSDVRKYVMSILYKEIVKLLVPETLCPRVWEKMEEFDAICNFAPAHTTSMWLLCGMQGAGKTSAVSKLAWLLTTYFNKKVLIAACDYVRPAAYEQICGFCSVVEIPVVHIENASPITNIIEAKQHANINQYDVLLVDISGNLNDGSELEKLCKTFDFNEVLWVSSIVYGIQAIDYVSQLPARKYITGMIITMLDGLAKGGICLSLVDKAQVPIKFETFGEKQTDIRVFNALSMADRIIGCGDIVNLIKTAKETVSKQSEISYHKLIKNVVMGNCTFNDLRNIVKLSDNMGGIDMIKYMLPDYVQELMNVDTLKILNVVLDSMTKEELECKVVMNKSRIQRIAYGSGVPLEKCKDIMQLPQKMCQAVNMFMTKVNK